jgi:hypothetical protein
MTLNLTLAAPWGIWQSCDYRVSDVVVDAYGKKRLVPRQDFFSPKFLDISCPDGYALMTYTGVAELPCPPRFVQLALVSNIEDPELRAGAPMSVADWAAWSLHGPARSVDQSVQHLQAEAAKDPTLSKRPHMFTYAAFLGDDAWIAQTSNVDEWPFGPVEGYGTVAERVTAARPRALATGDPRSMTRAEYEEFEQLVRAPPRRPAKLLERLAELNKRAASRTCTVSPECATRSIFPPGHAPRPDQPRGRQFGDVPPGVDLVRSVWNGINTTPHSRAFRRRALEFFAELDRLPDSSSEL